VTVYQHEHIKPIRFKIQLELEGEVDEMTQITAGPFTVTVAPATTETPLTVTPLTGTLPGETEGLADAGDLVATVTGGTPPYTLSNPTGLPDGMTLNEGPSADGSPTDVDVTISGTPSAGDSTGGDGAGNYEVGFDVTDSATPAAKFKAKVKKAIR
jgi:hypothetical protein